MTKQELKRLFWEFIHDRVVHLFMVFLPFAFMDKLHDWTVLRAFPWEMNDLSYVDGGGI